MRDWTSREAREAYLGFFEGKGHRRLESFSLIPNNDPTLLLIGAGMAPFKPEFAGKVTPISPRVTTCQKCVRADDIEHVGRTSRHHTFFEMLGNFSFGDYFKGEACAWAWELVTTVYRLPVERLWVTIHPDDEEAFRIWTGAVGVARDRVVRIAENFWGPIGTSGPCGPCSEILYDRGPEWGCGKPGCAAGCDCDRYLEFWNLVFTMFHRDVAAGTTEDLPKKNIDTGMGLERMVMILQGTASPFETDLLAPLMGRILGERWRDRVPRNAGGGADADLVAARIVADHARAAVFMAADTITPSNEGRGYVMRQIIRRAIRHGRTIGVESLVPLVPLVRQIMGAIYPELVNREAFVARVIEEEERHFRETLDRGLAVAEKLLGGKTERRVSGEEAAELYDTYGFPLELLLEIARERGFTVDEAGFQTAMDRRRELAQKASAVKGEKGGLFAPFEGIGGTEFLGYHVHVADAAVAALSKRGKGTWARVDRVTSGDEVVVVLDRTPFYAEGGGPVGDRGAFRWDGGRIEVRDTRKDPAGVHGHVGIVTEGTLAVGNLLVAEVDEAFREGVRRHHTATHLLHAALREVLGGHVAQAGSLVAPDRLRFDFSHFAALTSEEIHRIETLVNRKIREGIPTTVCEVSMEEARKRGAIAFFDEKYGERVRVVEVADFSRELCGGIHVRNTAEIGLFKIVSEEAIGQGLRRVEAKVAEALEAHLAEREAILAQVAGLLKVAPQEVPAAVEQALARVKELERRGRELDERLAAREAEGLAARAEECAGVRFVAAQVDAATEGLRAMVDQLKGRLKSGVVLLASIREGKVAMVAGVTPDLVSRGFSAGALVKEAARVVGGSGGGRPEMAQAGGKDPSKIDQALGAARRWLEAAVQQK